MSGTTVRLGPRCPCSRRPCEQAAFLATRYGNRCRATVSIHRGVPRAYRGGIHAHHLARCNHIRRSIAIHCWSARWLVVCPIRWYARGEELRFSFVRAMSGRTFRQWRVLPVKFIFLRLRDARPKASSSVDALRAATPIRCQALQ
jgi:hypothetical protein